MLSNPALLSRYCARFIEFRVLYYYSEYHDIVMLSNPALLSQYCARFIEIEIKGSSLPGTQQTVCA